MSPLKMMKRICSGQKKQRNMIFISLLCFLFSGVGFVQSLPILVMALGNSHPVFVTESQGKTHLVLHHRGNHDDHEKAGPTAHQHDLLDKVIAFSGKGEISHTDHEVEIPVFKEKVMTKTKNVVVAKNLASFRIDQILPTSIKLDVIQFTPHSPPTTNPTIGSLHKIILLI